MPEQRGPVPELLVTALPQGTKDIIFSIYIFCLLGIMYPCCSFMTMGRVNRIRSKFQISNLRKLLKCTETSVGDLPNKLE